MRSALDAARIEGKVTVLLSLEGLFASVLVSKTEVEGED